MDSEKPKKARGRPRKEFTIPDDLKDDPTMNTMYNHWCAMNRAKRAYYMRNRERILTSMKNTKKTETDDRSVTQVAIKN